MKRIGSVQASSGEFCTVTFSRREVSQAARACGRERGRALHAAAAGHAGGGRAPHAELPPQRRADRGVRRQRPSVGQGGRNQACNDFFEASERNWFKKKTPECSSRTKMASGSRYFRRQQDDKGRVWIIANPKTPADSSTADYEYSMPLSLREQSHVEVSMAHNFFLSHADVTILPILGSTQPGLNTVDSDGGSGSFPSHLEAVHRLPQSNCEREECAREPRSSLYEALSILRLRTVRAGELSIYWS